MSLIAGPCVIEDEAGTLEIAAALKEIAAKENVPFIFKASYDKGNRTSENSYRGPGLKQGLSVLAKVKEKLGVPVLTDVHCHTQVAEVAEVVDIVQIPAFLCRQTDLIKAVAAKAKCINIKKGQFMAPWDMQPVIKKIESAGNKNIFLTERGTSFGYNQLVNDLCALPIMRSYGYPVVFDVTHSLQLPGGLGDKSGGCRQFIPQLARAAVACGCELVFMEVHQDPERALCDGPNSFPLAEVRSLITELIQIDNIVKKRKATIYGQG